VLIAAGGMSVVVALGSSFYVMRRRRSNGIDEVPEDRKALADAPPAG
jgi:hypothetical protein